MCPQYVPFTIDPSMLKSAGCVEILGLSLFNDFACRSPRSICSPPSDFVVVDAWYGEKRGREAGERG